MNATKPAEPPTPDGELLLRCLDSEAGQRDATLEALCRAHPGQAPSLRQLYALLDRFGLVDEPAALDEPRALEQVGPYRVLELLGSGGMGVVYRAEHTGLGRQVALKVLHHGFAATGKARERFRREALAAARLDHPGICPVYEVGDVDGAPFLAMRYVKGPSLQQLLATSRRGPHDHVALPRRPGESAEAAVLRFVAGIALALHTAHEAGLVHRDVKPGNVMVTPEGEPVLLDFGLARFDDSADEGLTRTGDQLGTPSYMAPEQIVGRAVDRRTDVWALGVVLYECLTLRPPFDAANRHGLQSQILHDEPPDPRRHGRGVGRDLWIVLQTALAKEPAERYRSAEAFAEDLRRLRCHEPILARRMGAFGRMRRFARRHPVATGLLAFLCVVAGAFATLLEQRTEALAEAGAALQVARAHELAVRALAAARTSPADALDLALDAVARSRTVETVSALHEVMVQHHERLRLEHAKSTWQAAFSPDGERFVTTSDTGHARVFDRSGTLLRSVPHNLQPGRGAMPVYDLHFDPSRNGAEARFVTASDDGSARVLGRDGSPLLLLDHNEPHNLSGAPDGHFSLYDPTALPQLWRARFAPDGRHVATSCSDRLVRIWNGETGKLVAKLAGHTTALVELAWSPTGWLASADNMDAWTPETREFAVMLWRPDGDGLALAARLPVPDSVHRLAWSEHGDTLAAAGRDGTAWVYEIGGGEVVDTRPLGHGDAVVSVSFAPDGRLLTAANDGSLRLWLRAGDPLATAWLDARAIAAEFAGGNGADGPLRILSTSADHTVRVFDEHLRALQVLRGHSDMTWSARLAPDGRQVLSTSWDGTVRAWDLFDPALPRVFAHRGRVRALARLPDGRIVSVADDRAACVTDLGDGSTQSFELGFVPWSIDLSHDGRRMLVGSGAGNGTVREFDPATAELRRTYEAPRSQWTVGMLLGPERAVIAGHTKLELVGPTEPAPWRRQFGSIYALRHAPQRALVAAAGRGYELPLWRASGERLPGLRLPARVWTISLRWSPDERWLAAGTAQGGEVWLWRFADDGDAAPEPLRLGGHGGAVHDLAFSPSGRLFAAACGDGAVHLWQFKADGPERVAVLRGHGGTAVRAVVFASEHLLCSGGDDGAIQSWLTSVDDLVALAERRRPVVQRIDGNLDGNELEFLVASDRLAEALALGERLTEQALAAGDDRRLSFVTRTITSPLHRAPERSPELLALAARAATAALELAAEPDFSHFEPMARIARWRGDLAGAIAWQEKALASCPPGRASDRLALERQLEFYRQKARAAR